MLSATCDWFCTDGSHLRTELYIRIVKLKSIDLSLIEGDMDLCSCARECELM